MSGENGGQGGNNQGGNEGGNKGGDDNKQEQQNQFQPVTFKTQAEYDAAFAERANRAKDQGKSEALSFLPEGVKPEDLVNGYTEWKKAEDAKKDPATLEREKREQTERELQEYKNRDARNALSKEVAKEIKIGDTPIPAELLAGTTKEEMKAHGEALVSFISALVGQAGPRAPQFNPLQGQNGNDQTRVGDPIRNLFMTGSFQ